MIFYFICRLSSHLVYLILFPIFIREKEIISHLNFGYDESDIIEAQALEL